MVEFSVLKTALPQVKQAEGSSLSQSEQSDLNDGKIIVHSKRGGMVKYFVKTSDGHLCSATIWGVHSAVDVAILKGLGYQA